VTGSYNGLPLSWYTTNGGVTYSATYIVAGGNSDQAYPLQITGVMLTDQFGVTSGPMSGTDVAKTIVGSSPSIYEMTPVPATSMTNSPSYAFNSNKAGTIRYTGDCFGQTTYAYAGANTVTFSPLSVGLHNNCTIIVTDSAGNSSNQIMVSPFTISGDATNTPLPITPITPVAPTTPVTPTTNPTASDLAAQLATLQSQLEAAMAAQKAPANKYVFTKPLDYGSSGSEVLELQNRLKSVGYLKATPNGNYGPATLAAVKAFQRANGVSPLGNVGPATRAALNR